MAFRFGLLRILLVFGLLLGPISGQALDSCAAILATPVPISSNDMTNLQVAVGPSGFASVVELGRGIAGRVFEIRRSEEQVVIKIYDSLSKAANDWFGLALIRSSLPESLRTTVAEPQWMKGEFVHEQYKEEPILFRMPLIKGRTLHSILLDSSVQASEKEELTKKYMTLLGFIRTGMAKKFGTICEERIPSDLYFRGSNQNTGPDGLPMLKARIDRDSSGAKFYPELRQLFENIGSISNQRLDPKEIASSFSIIIKTDNIIIDKDRNLHLIDPE